MAGDNTRLVPDRLPFTGSFGKQQRAAKKIGMTFTAKTIDGNILALW
jgi:hypothetical protein